MSIRTIAHTFAWFGIGLGAVELLAPKAFGRLTGLAGRQALIRTMGVREVGTGIALFLASAPAPWMVVRAAGDALDAGVFANVMSSPVNPKRSAARVMFWASLGAFALDAGFAWHIHDKAKKK